jgi:hypothetical protein
MPNMAAPAAPCFSQINRPTITALEAMPHHTRTFCVSWRHACNMLRQHDIMTFVATERFCSLKKTIRRRCAKIKRKKREREIPPDASEFRKNRPVERLNQIKLE